MFSNQNNSLACTYTCAFVCGGTKAYHKEDAALHRFFFHPCQQSFQPVTVLNAQHNSEHILAKTNWSCTIDSLSVRSVAWHVRVGALSKTLVKEECAGLLMVLGRPPGI